jgi:2',3'-cyclic-nucleotide 2'-phosphodiesterase (5'-nucleotidase family)
MMRAITAVFLFVVVVAAGARAESLTVIGTTDLHGRVDKTPMLAGYVNAIRKKTKVVLVDAGDMFQGTLESNPNEGESVVQAYNALGYDAAAIGNHEFDFGPLGPLAVPRNDKDDARGALKARAAQAKFPMLAANLFDEETGKPVRWPNVTPSALVSKGKMKIGIIGLTSFETPKTTMAANFKGLQMAPLVPVIVDEAAALRKKGAHVIVVSAHAGGRCEKVDNANDTSSCKQDEEIFQVAKALPPGTVDVIVGGHTHQQVAHVVNGVAIVQAWANGQGFSRVDLDVDIKGKRARIKQVHPPTALCAEASCTYDGVKIAPDAKVAQVIEPYLAFARAEKAREIGARAATEIRRSYDDESALGNLFADIILEAATAWHGKADVALMNGGGIRANLPAGSITYGQVFEMMPFDNRLAIIKTKGSDLRRWLENKLTSPRGGFLSLAGIQVDVLCHGSKARVTMTRPDGRQIRDDEEVAIATTDFLASGGEDYRLPDATITTEEEETLRDKIVRSLVQRKIVRGDDPALFDPNRPRFFALDGKNPRCGKRS